MSKSFFKDKINLVALIFSLLINSVIWFILVFKLKHGNFPLILHYNAYFGVDYLGKYGEAFVIPVVGLLVITVNYILAGYLFNRSKLAAKLLVVAVVIIQVLLVAGAMAVVMLNA